MKITPYWFNSTPPHPTQTANQPVGHHANQPPSQSDHHADHTSPVKSVVVKTRAAGSGQHCVIKKQARRRSLLSCLVFSLRGLLWHFTTQHCYQTFSNLPKQTLKIKTYNWQERSRHFRDGTSFVSPKKVNSESNIPFSFIDDHGRKFFLG